LPANRRNLGESADSAGKIRKIDFSHLGCTYHKFLFAHSTLELLLPNRLIEKATPPLDLPQMRFNFSTHSAAPTTTTTTQANGGDKAAQPLKKAIEADPDSLDSVISNPQSYPITIVPNRPTSFYGLSPNGKASGFPRSQPSCR